MFVNKKSSNQRSELSIYLLINIHIRPALHFCLDLFDMYDINSFYYLMMQM